MTGTAGPHHRWRWIVLGVLALAVAAAAFVVFRREHQRTEATETFCARIAAARDLDAVFIGGDRTALEDDRRALADAAAAAPEEIVEQVRLLRDVTDEIATTLDTVRDPTVAAAQVAERRRDDLARIEAAGAAVVAYARANCGITLGTTPADGTTPGSVATSTVGTTPGR